MVTLNLTESEAKLVMNEMEVFLEARGENDEVDQEARSVVEKIQSAGVTWADN